VLVGGIGHGEVWEVIPVDQAARLRAADVLVRYRAREITNDMLERAWPSSSDPAIAEIEHAVWLTYDDLHEHLADGSSNQLLDRAIAFLKTAEPYAWPAAKRWQRIALLPLSLATRGWVDRLFWPSPIDSNSWPFASESAWRAASSSDER
jgi:hypothetical protein